jgi:hypothetical protein
MSGDMEKKLRDMGKQDKTNYPPELRSATRAEFTTLIRTSKPKPGCPLMGSMMLLGVGGGLFGLYYIVTHILMGYFDLVMWMLGNS